MDLLSDILKNSGLKRRILEQRSFSDSMSMQFPCDKSIGFHVVTYGEAYIHTHNGSDPIILKKGDLALMSRGCIHTVSNSVKLSNNITTNDKIDKIKLSLVSGAYQFWNTPVHPFFKELPAWYVLRFEEIENFDNIQLIINLLSSEVAHSKIGSETVIQNLLDILFSLIIRKIISLNQSQVETWSHAVHNKQIKLALELIHSDCSIDWTLDELAKKVGLSRAGFAQKFKKVMGDTPLHYLTAVRIQKAMSILSETTDNIEVVAEAVGYKDAFSFSKIFKKITGIPPREFRNKDRSEKNLNWRF